VHAELELANRRLSDFLNAHSELTLHNVRLQGHADGMVITADEFDLRLDEVLAVEAAGWRGHPERRVRTKTRRADLVLGPYRVLGRLHAPPSADAFQALHLRRTMVPLTDVTIALPMNGQTIMRDVETLIVNRHAIDVLAEQPAELLADLPLAVAIDPRAKDMTGEIYAN